MRPKKRKTYADDDGRVIANMNVEGMPWYRKASPRENANAMQELSPREYRQILRTATLTALGIAFVLSAAMVLFVWICTLIWR